MRWITLMFALFSACTPTTSATMGTPVSGKAFERDIAGQVLSFRRPGERVAEAQFQPDGTVVYSGEAMNRIGRWRPWERGYCAYYPWLGSGLELRPPFSGPVESDGYRCYVVRAESDYYVLFQPDGTYVGTLVPVPG
jgi:hypothetical protein